jgi:murein endopeptidase
MGPSISKFIPVARSLHFIRSILIQRFTAQALTDTESWTTSGSYARGCPTSGACAFPTDCQDNSITYDNGDIASW